MRRILLSLVLITALGAAVVVGTRAYFTDQAVVDNNTLGAGKLDFTLNGDMTESKKVNLSDMEPGKWYGPYKMDIYNKNSPASTMAIKYRASDKFESQTVAGFYDK